MADYIKTQIGAEMDSLGQNYIAGQVKSVSARPVDKDRMRTADKTLFHTQTLAGAKESAGEMSIYSFEVDGGLCGLENLMNRGSGVISQVGSGHADYNLTVPCTRLDIVEQQKPPFPSGDGDVFCVTADENLATNRVGKIVIRNIGSDLPTYGYEDVARTSGVIHTESPFPNDMGDVVYWGIATERARSDTDQYSEAQASGMIDLLCDCDGVPGWFGRGTALWSPCSTGTYNSELNPSNPPKWVYTDRTYACTNVIWKGALQPGGAPTVWEIPIDSPSATGLTLKFIAGPGEYTKKANSGQRFQPTNTNVALQQSLPTSLYRDIRKPCATVKVEVYPVNT